MVRDGYKMTEIGVIPDEWDACPISEFCITSSGGTPNRKRPEYYLGGTIPWVKTGELKSKYLIDTEEKITKDALKNSSAKLFPVNTLLVAMYGATIGKSSILKVSAASNQACCAITCNPKKADFEFLYYALNHRVDKLVELSAGGAQPNISQQIISSFLVPLPPFPEQQKIADILSTVDEHISEIESLIEKTKVLKQGMMQRLLTKGIGHTEFKDTEIGRIPVEWEVSSLSKFASIYRGASPRPINDPKWFTDKGYIGWIRIADVTRSKKYLFQTTQYLSSEGVSKSRLVDNGKLIMSICGTIGRPIIVKTPSCIHDGFIVFEDTDNHIVDTEFLYYWVLQHEEYFRSQGQKGTQANINTGIVGNTIIALPLLLEQQKIAAYLSTIDERIDNYQTKLAALTRLKTGLMQQLLTGKIQVKT